MSLRDLVGGGKGDLPDPNAPVDPRQLEARINDLRALLTSSSRQLESLARDEVQLVSEEKELVERTKAALQKGDRATAARHAVDLDKKRKDLARTRERAAAMRASHDKAAEIARGYEKAAAIARPERPAGAPTVQARLREPAPREKPARSRLLSPLDDLDAGELADQAISAAKRTVDWLKDLVLEPAPSRGGDGPGKAAFESGDHERTIAECTRELARDPRNAVAYCNRAAALATLGRYEDAKADCSRAIGLDPRHALSWSNRASCRLCLDDYDGAIEDATKALELDPGLALARYNRGRAHASLGSFAPARDDYLESTRLDPNYALAHAHLAVAHLALGDPSAAILSASRALRIDPSLAFAHRARAQARLAAATVEGVDPRAAKRELEGALEDLDEAMKEGESPGDRNLRARILHAAGDSEGALAEVESAVQELGDETVKVVARATWLADTGDVDGALRELGDGLDRGLAPGPLLVLRGETLSRLGDHDAALADLSRAVELDPSSGPALEARGRALFGSGEALRAFEDAEAALALGHAGALDVRGFARWELGDLEGACEDLEQALERTPTHDAAHECLARCRLALGKRASALRSFERAVELEPARVHAHLWAVALGSDRASLDDLAAGKAWESRLARLVRGDEDADSVLELARLAADDHRVRERLCDAHAFAGALRERAGDLAGALRHYDAALATGAEGASEWTWVRGRLARERERAPLADEARLEKLAASGVLTAAELAEAKRLLASGGCPPAPPK